MRHFGQWPNYSSACRRDMDRLLANGGGLSAYRSNPSWPVGPVAGSWAWRLERLTEALFGIKHVAACSSGTMALMAALWALDLPQGEVITSPYTFSATPAAIRWMGHEPVFADIDAVTYCLDPVSVAIVANPRTRAILPVDLFGGLADYDRLAAFKLPLVEDACQAVGAIGKHLRTSRPAFGGAFGDIGVYSFNGAKNVPAGEAGAIVTNDDRLAKRARRWLSHGCNWDGYEIGLNGRINEPTALIAYHGMKALMKNNRRRQELARVLIGELRSVSGIRTLPDPTGHALYVFAFRLAEGVDRAAFAKRLKAMGVEVGEGYIVPPLHRYPAFADCRRADLPVVEDLSAKSLCLLTQVRPPATPADMRWLGLAIRSALGEAKPVGRRRVGATPLVDI